MRFNWKVGIPAAIFTLVVAVLTSAGVSAVVGQPAGLYLSPLAGILVGTLIGKLTAPLVWRDR